MHCSLPGFSVFGKNTGVGCHFLLQGDLLDPGITSETPLSTASKEGSLPTAPSGKPKEGDKPLKQNKTKQTGCLKTFNKFHKKTVEGSGQENGGIRGILVGEG